MSDTEELEKCKYCSGLGTVSNYVNGINFEEKCCCCKGTGRKKKRKGKSNG